MVICLDIDAAIVGRCQPLFTITLSGGVNMCNFSCRFMLYGHEKNIFFKSYRCSVVAGFLPAG